MTTHTAERAAEHVARHAAPFATAALTPTIATPDALVDSRAGSRRGFALLSLMVAVVLLATGVMAIGAANTARLRSQTHSTARSAGLNVARAYLENVRGRDPWSLATEAAVTVDGRGNIASNGEFTRVLLVTVNQTNLVTLQVIVTGPRLTAPIRLVTNAYRGGTIVVGP
jgi:Tfp pilus assembly protein PilV